jgi:chorismate synthase
MLNINAVKGFEFGSGFDSVNHRGSELNDEWIMLDQKAQTKTNHSGGIQGGISNGMPIVFNVAFKPTSSIALTQQTLNKNLEPVNLNIEGRHDPCVVPRAIPIVESLAAIVLLDNLLIMSHT